MDLAKLALTGLIGGTMGLAACTGPGELPTPDQVEASVDAVKKGTDKVVDDAKTVTTDAVDAAVAYTETHTCAGKNTCKGLGGCKVTADSLAAMGAKMGVEGDALGAPHDCKGLNSCKGLGGCSVDAEKLAALKAKLAGGSTGH